MNRDTLVFRTGRPGWETEQKQLWKAVFGDSDTYIETFYRSRLYAPERMVLAREDGDLAAMCALLPVRLRLPDGTAAEAAYLYALATAPARRGRGIAHHLLAYVDEHLRKTGCAGVCTVPARPTLHPFFASAGYREGFSLRVTEHEAAALPVPRPEDTVREIAAEEYRALRGPLLAGQFYVEYDTAYLTHQQAVCRLSGGGLYALEADGVTGLAAVEREGDALTVKELLVPPALISRALAALAAALPAARYHVCAPDGPGVPVALGMMRWYSGTYAAAATEGYLAFPLD